MSDQEEYTPPEEDYIPKEDDEVVACCQECGNTVPDSRAEKDVFLQNGQPGVCPYCGGVLGVTYASQVQKIRDKRTAKF